MAKRTYQEVTDRLAKLAAEVNLFKIALNIDDQGGTKEQTLQEWLQFLEAHELDIVKQELTNLTKLVGTYADDVDGNLDTNVSVVKNLSIAVSNITAILDREKNYATKQELTDGDGATLTAAAADATAKANKALADAKIDAAAKDIVIKNAAAADATTKANKALADAKIDAAAKDIVIKNAAAADATAKANAAKTAAITEAKKYHDENPQDLDGKADIDFTNVIVPAGNEGKFLQVKADLTIEYVDAPSGAPTWTEINDLWTNPNRFAKYKDRLIRISYFRAWGQRVQMTQLIINENNDIDDQEMIGTAFDSNTRSEVSVILLSNTPDKANEFNNDGTGTPDVSDVKIVEVF